VNAISGSIDQLVGALAAAQAEITGVERNREVTVKPKQKQKQNGESYQPPSYKFKYATLDSIVAHLRPILTEHGLWFVQFVAGGQMVTRILHSSGQWLDAGVPMPNVSGTPQEIGAIISYFKRYSLSAAFAIVTEEDDDSGSTVEGEDRSVSFYSNRRPSEDDHRPAVTGVEEPEGGWGDWARTLIAQVEKAKDDDAIDLLRDDNKRLINSVKKVDAFIHKHIMEAFTKRRTAVNPNAGF
jgi:hypothetical protein